MPITKAHITAYGEMTKKMGGQNMLTPWMIGFLATFVVFFLIIAAISVRDETFIKS